MPTRIKSDERLLPMSYENKALIVNFNFTGELIKGVNCTSDRGVGIIHSKLYGSTFITIFPGHNEILPNDMKGQMRGLEHPGGIDTLTVELLKKYEAPDVPPPDILHPNVISSIQQIHHPDGTTEYLPLDRVNYYPDGTEIELMPYNFVAGRVYGFCVSKEKNGRFNVQIFSPYKYDENYVNEQRIKYFIDGSLSNFGGRESRR